ncbi:MAG: hypothetical protein QOI89_3683 [Solirubrobacteraceae bacterium]|nr:hypothetical protein [Solirubrobacteraceae bacterium]
MSYIHRYTNSHRGPNLGITSDPTAKQVISSTKIRQSRASGGPCSGMASGLGTRVVGHPGRGYSIASAPKRSRPGVGIQLVQRVGCSSWTPTPGLLRASSRRDGIPASVPCLAAGSHPACAISVPLTAVNHGQWRVPVTGLDHGSRPLTAQWAQPSKLAMRVRFLSPAPPRSTDLPDRLYRWRGAARETAFVRGRGRPRLPAC